MNVRRLSLRRVLPLLAGVGLLAGGAQVALASDGANGLQQGVAVPQFMLPVVNSESFTDSKRWGPAKWVGQKPTKKLVIMSFFATYCEPCKKEMPELVRLYEKYGDQELGVMLVSIDKGKEKREEVVALAKENGVPFPVMHDRFQVVARRYKAERLPYMLMVGPDGVIKDVHVGYTEEMKAGLENEVRGQLGLEPLAVEPTPVAEAPVKKKKKKGKRGSKKRSK